MGFWQTTGNRETVHFPTLGLRFGVSNDSKNYHLRLDLAATGSELSCTSEQLRTEGQYCCCIVILPQQQQRQQQPWLLTIMKLWLEEQHDKIPPNLLF